LVTGREIVGYVGEREERIGREENATKGHWRKEKRGEKTKQNPTALMHPRLDQK